MSQVLQNVNLYLPEFRKKKYWLNAEKMVLVAGAAVLVLLITTAYEYFQLVRLRTELAEKEAQRQEIVAATATLISQYGVQTEDPTLLANIEELQQGLQSQQALLQFLEGRDLGNADGFSEHLADLSRYHLQGLSLNHISLTDGGRSVELAGQVLRGELVTLFLKNLSQGEMYAGKVFETFNLQTVPATTGGDQDAAANTLEVMDFHVRTLSQGTPGAN